MVELIRLIYTQSSFKKGSRDQNLKVLSFRIKGSRSQDPGWREKKSLKIRFQGSGLKVLRAMVVGGMVRLGRKKVRLWPHDRVISWVREEKLDFDISEHSLFLGYNFHVHSCATLWGGEA